jgi:quinol monooxygenase YgiN
MLIIHVNVSVKPECVAAFKEATIANARESLKEPGVARFDLGQQADDPTCFIIVEAYRTADAPAQHKETHHYQVWRDAVAPMMAGPRVSIKYRNIHPVDDNY